MFQVDEFFERFIKWILYKYLPVFLQNETDFFQFIAVNFSGDAKKKDKEFLEQTFKRFKADASEIQKKKLRKELVDELKHEPPVQIISYNYSGLKGILLSVFEDKEKNVLGFNFLINAAITDFTGFAQACEDEKLKQKLLIQEADEGLTILHHAVFYQSVIVIRCINNIDDHELLDRLLQIQDDDGKTPLQHAFENDSAEVILAFKQHPESPQEFAQRIINGKSLLYSALENNAYNFAKAILPQINLNNFPDGNQALHAAAYSGNINLVKLVLFYCSDKNTLSFQSGTPIGAVLAKMNDLNQQQKKAIVRSKQELQEEMGDLSKVILFLLKEGIKPNNQDQHFIKDFADKKIIPMEDSNVKTIVDNYRKEVRLKLFLCAFIAVCFWPVYEGTQYIGAATEAGSFSGLGTFLVVAPSLLIIAAFNGVLTPRDKFIAGLASTLAFFQKISRKLHASRRRDEQDREFEMLLISTHGDSMSYITEKLEGSTSDFSGKATSTENLESLGQAVYPNSESDSDSDESKVILTLPEDKSEEESAEQSRMQIP